ncbi:alpha/beta fold hydrolase [Paenibacillus glycinis]|uniref:Alpha/beta fold hydrolase n=1 Tax=Paenibacillus glycinis TaxID=2697035 RepID=A0ABW9XY80_9BACL|nr:alpha/beta fold hydrolase [Paenibacillus glycinis]NBD27192.1 alpha/beta fold hydrolase [Paenibacillus glycinis]
MAIRRSAILYGVLCGTLLLAAALPGQASAHPVPQPARLNPTLAFIGSTTSRHGQAAVDAVQGDAWFDNYTFRSGETLERLRIHYATMGTPHRNAHGDIDNAVLVLHWTGADSRALLAPNFRKALYDPGKPLDARRYYLIFVDNVGHGQSSKPSDGLRAGFPNYGYGDLVDLQHKLVTETLGIKRLHAILGMSMGGMNAWQWAEAYPDAMDGVMPVVSFPIQVSGRNLLWRHIVTDAIRSDPEWMGGNYTKPPRGWLQSYAVLRMMIDGVAHLQETLPDGAAADEFLAETRKQAALIDANDMLYSLKSSADYNPEPGLSSIKTKLFALNFSDDAFNPEELRVLERLVPKVKNGRFFVQPGSPISRGHLTMAQPELWSRHVAAFMRWLGDPPPGAAKMNRSRK